VGAAHRLRVLQLVDPLIERHPRTDAEDQDRHHERPEVELHAITERVKLIGRPGSPLHAVKQQTLVADIDERMDSLAQHCRTASVGRSNKLGDGDQRVAGERRKDDLT